MLLLEGLAARYQLKQALCLLAVVLCPRAECGTIDGRQDVVELACNMHASVEVDTSHLKASDDVASYLHGNLFQQLNLLSIILSMLSTVDGWTSWFAR